MKLASKGSAGTESVQQRRRFADKRLTPYGSAALDVVRFGAAFVVCYGHFSTPLYSAGWKPRLDLAGYAVAVFFVLSGFVMRLVTRTRSMTAREYCVDRLSRMYSVVIPALLFTVAVNLVGLLYTNGHLPRALFAPTGKLVLYTLSDLLFVSQWLGLNISNPCNPVFWSLSYECSYYLLFGLIIFGRGRKKWIGIAGTCLLLGLPILLLFPVWLLGWLAHDVYQRLRIRPRAWLSTTAMLVAAGIAAAALAEVIKSGVLRLQLSPPIQWMRSMDRSLHERNLHIFQRAGISFYAVGIPTAVLIIWLLLISDRLQQAVPIQSVRWIRVVAEGTFSLYLMHLALLTLIAYLIPYPKDNLIVKCSILLFTVCFCVAISVPMEHFKLWLRRVLHVRQRSLLEAVKGGAASREMRSRTGLADEK